MDASNLPKGQSEERNSDGRPLNLPGIYREKTTGAKFITAEGREGIAQADALMSENMYLAHKHTWERIGDVPSRLELQAMRKAQEVKDAANEALEKGKEAAELKAATKAAIEAAKEEATV